MPDDKCRSLHPQTQIMVKGYDPQLSEGAAVPPVFRTSTFIFKKAEHGKRAFEIAYGLRPAEPGESPALIYTRVNNPNCEMVEDRVVAWDGMPASLLFSSGMSAISCACLTFLRPGDSVIFSDPIYGGTEYLFRHLLPEFGITGRPFPAGSSESVMEELVAHDPTVKIIYLESPANPTNVLTDIGAARRIADRHSTGGRLVRVFVDNTFMGPIFSRPRKLGADVILYSATKFIGGHSDLVAGIAMGSREVIDRVRATRTILGSNSDPDTAWLILRSLGTLQLRMEKQQQNALRLVDFLGQHDQVEGVAYPGLQSMGDYQVRLARSQLEGTGSLITFRVKGGEREAFKVLDSVKLFHLAVSLGGIESLIEHPATMTHSDMTREERYAAGITDNMIRVSVGLEEPNDLIADMRRALDGL
ncbi:MAG TPA: aminotransferase class I/II-fold pyridoxal phosphate-dependent enzyme [Anaeromyxobacteraceae bacterium]|nr:aminotransferase class I/II-fold pyridoxal phosphate-dependent enzyme [Anaeromyxobacteraceae bacterium]